MAVSPHPPLRRYYGSEAERSVFVRALFNRLAPQYDTVNRILSVGWGRSYRRTTLQRAGLTAGMRVLDLATGTGLVAREAQGLVGREGHVIGLDLTENMLAQARRTLRLPVVQARAELLPVGAARVDFLSMGYALRHVPDLDVAFSEFRRVLRPSGILLLLEFGRPSSALGNALAASYFRHFIPALCRLSGADGARELLSYCWDTVDQCVPPGVIVNALTGAGFVDVTCESSMGVFRSYRARRPAIADGTSC